jgi:hypothetical protein
LSFAALLLLLLGLSILQSDDLDVARQGFDLLFGGITWKVFYKERLVVELLRVFGLFGLITVGLLFSSWLFLLLSGLWLLLLLLLLLLWLLDRLFLGWRLYSGGFLRWWSCLLVLRLFLLVVVIVVILIIVVLIVIIFIVIVVLKIVE